jgi:hypothetical protein
VVAPAGEEQEDAMSGDVRLCDDEVYMANLATWIGSQETQAKVARTTEEHYAHRETAELWRGLRERLRGLIELEREAVDAVMAHEGPGHPMESLCDQPAVQEAVKRRVAAMMAKMVGNGADAGGGAGGGAQ